MKKTALCACALLAIALVACNRNEGPEVVKETYIHKYGVPVPKSDWARNGKDGQVVHQQSDGVTVTRGYEKGTLHGQTSYTYPNSSTVQRVELFDRGNLKARTENYPSGVPMSEEKYDGRALAVYTRWYEDGTPQAIERYAGEAMVSAEYRTPLNVLESRIHEGCGTRITRGTDGELLCKDTIQNGHMVERVTFFPNGDPSSVTPYENRKIHGSRLTFLQGGLPNTVEAWIEGQQDGMTIVYQNGEKVAEVPYTKGEKNGVELRYRDGKELVEEVTWRAGVQHGPRKLFIDDGTTKTEWYHQGEHVSRTAYERLNVR